MQKLTSHGKCHFCDKVFKKAGINRHLGTHLVKMTVTDKPGKSFHLKVETDSSWGSTPYFLSLWINGSTTMQQLDDFLRSIWLECCGHLSSFVNPKNKPAFGGWDYIEAQKLIEAGKIKAYEKLMEEANGEIPMSRRANLVFKKDLKFEYEYDFGSTTALDITVVNEYPIACEKPIVLLSRNEPLNMLCETCGKYPAHNLCNSCYSYGEEGMFCEKCAEIHEESCADFADYASTPIVNSPRMGVCGYEGGTIDVERDGVYQLLK